MTQPELFAVIAYGDLCRTELLRLMPRPELDRLSLGSGRTETSGFRRHLHSLCGQSRDGSASTTHNGYARLPIEQLRHRRSHGQDVLEHGNESAEIRKRSASAEGGLEGPLRLRPEGIGFGDLRAASPVRVISRLRRSSGSTATAMRPSRSGGFSVWASAPESITNASASSPRSAPIVRSERGSRAASSSSRSGARAAS